MTSLASKHELYPRHALEREPRALESDAREARDVDDAPSHDTELRSPIALVAGVVAALGAVVLGLAAGLGYLQLPALNPGPEPEPLTAPSSAESGMIHEP
jgi:hypothetical protein